MGRELAIWVIVLICGVVTQLIKFLVYSLAQRKLTLPMLAESVGLPSLHAAILTCMTVLVVIRVGAESTLAGLSLVFTVIVLHDTMRLRSASQMQRLVLYQLVQIVPGAIGYPRRVAPILTERAHQPFHVAMGVLFGLLFAWVWSL